MDTEGYGGGNCFSLAPWMFSGYVGIYRRKKYVSGRSWGPGDRGAPRRGGRALPSPGRLDCFLTCTPSSPDHVRSKNHAPEGFIPFGLRFDIPFLRNTEIGKKTTIWAGPPVSRLVPKMI